MTMLISYRQSKIDQSIFEKSRWIPKTSGPPTVNLGWNELLRRDIVPCGKKLPRAEKLNKEY